MCWESCGARLGERFPDRLAPTRSGTFSAYDPCQAACKSPRSHRQPEAGTRETCRGDPRAARAMGAHADPQRRPSTASRMGFRLAVAARAFACGRIRILRRGCPGGWREEEGRERQGGALGRGGVREGRDGCGGSGGEGDGEGDISDAGLHPGAIGGSGPPPDAPMSSGDPSHRVRKWSEDHLLNTSGRSSVLQRAPGVRGSGRTDGTRCGSWGWRTARGGSVGGVGRQLNAGWCGYGDGRRDRIAIGQGGAAATCGGPSDTSRQTRQ